MKLNKASLYALFAVLELARDPGLRLATSDIADKYGISASHLAKIMRNLVQGGLVQSMCGPSGGCRFAGNVDRTTLFDIIQLFENQDSNLDLPGYGNYAGNSIVMELQNISNEIDAQFKAVLDSITLATALKSTRHCSGPGA
jgi:Rrf2 family protein